MTVGLLSHKSSLVSGGLEPAAAKLQPLLVLLGLSSAVVIVEPSLFDLGLVVLFVGYVASGGLVGVTRLSGSLLFVAFSLPAMVFPLVGGVGFIRYLIIELLFVFGFLALAEVALRHRGVLDSVLVGYVVGAALVSVIVLALYLVLPDTGWIYRDEFRTRVRGTFKDPNVFGPFLIFPLAVLLFHNQVRDRVPVLGQLRWARLGAALAMGACLALTLSRGALIAFLLTVVVVLIAGTPNPASLLSRHRIFFLSCSVVAFGLAMVVTGRANLGSQADSRLSVQAYDSERFEHLGIALAEVAVRPWGLGPGVFDEVHGNNPHNLFLGKATDAGLVAAFLLCGFLIWCTWRAYQAWRVSGKNLDLMLAASLVGHLVLSGVIYSHHWRHLYVLAIAALVRAEMVRLETDGGITPQARMVFK